MISKFPGRYPRIVPRRNADLVFLHPVLGLARGFRGFRLSIPMKTLQQPARTAFSMNPGIS